ncbi:MAG: BON domain-containing protein [Terriglobales bacterium]|jgi:osmotically-inducible protein OsmY
MQRSLFLIALLLCASLVSAKQTSTASSQDGKSASTRQEKQTQSVSQSGSSNNQQNDPNGGSPSSPAPGRVTGETPTQVQTALDKQLPTGSDVTASVTDDGSMKLTGTVKTEADKAKAEQIARSVSGRKIDNKLKVKSAQSNQDQSSNPK